MASFKLTNKAVADLSEIWEYTVEQWSEKQADKYYKLLIDGCSEIAKNALKGKSYFDVYPGVLGRQFSKHIIFYRIISPKSILIIRILHEQMDLKARLEK
jgi:toxin ParE1/3/4